MTSPPATTFDCPNTRKKKRDYAALHKYGLLAEDIPLPRPRKKMAVRPAHRIDNLCTCYSSKDFFELYLIQANKYNRKSCSAEWKKRVTKFA